MTDLQAHFTLQYGIDNATDQHWELEQPVKRALHTPIQSAWKRLADLQALTQHPKPGGHTGTELALRLRVSVKLMEEVSYGSLVKLLSSDIPAFIQAHLKWAEELAPVLAR